MQPFEPVLVRIENSFLLGRAGTGYASRIAASILPSRGHETMTSEGPGLAATG